MEAVMRFVSKTKCSIRFFVSRILSRLVSARQNRPQPSATGQPVYLVSSVFSCIFN